MAIAISAIAPTTATIDGAGTLQITGGVVTGGTTNITDWLTSDATVATVSSSGLVTAHRKGSATITARAAEDHTKLHTSTITVGGKQVLLGASQATLLQSLLAQRVQDLVATQGRDFVEIDKAKAALAQVQQAI